MSITYCVSCKTKTKNKNPKIKIVNKRNMQYSTCVKCGKNKTSFVSSGRRVQAGGSIADKFISALPVELHLLGTDELTGKTRKSQFIGPGTKLDKRLGPGDIPHGWSKPINDLDKGAYHHDICYRDHKDATKRNICDKALIKVADTFAKKPGVSMLDKIDTKIVNKAMNLIKRKT